MYLSSMIFIVIGGGVGYALFNRVAAIFAFMIGFSLIAFLVFPGIFGLVI